MKTDLLIAYAICSLPILFGACVVVCLIFGPFPLGDKLSHDDYYP